MQRHRAGSLAWAPSCRHCKKCHFAISVIPEAEDLGHPYRSANHYSHRVIFRIDEPSTAVYIVRVYNGARRALTRKDVG